MLGDWCAVEDFCPGSSDGCLADPGWTSGDATSAFYFVKNLEVMVQMANATGRHADVSKYEAALAHARGSYRRAFFNESTEDFGPTQTGNALGILAAPSVEPGAVKTLLANLKSRGGHLSTGKETHHVPLRSRFLLCVKNASFCQDMLGTNIGKALKTNWRFLRRRRHTLGPPGSHTCEPGKKTVSFCPFIC
jgi:hypothetical protein